MTLQSLRDLVKDDQVFTFAARVTVDPKSGTHYQVNEEGYVIISCTTQSGHRLWANLSLDVDESGRGVWKLPAVGTEVLIGTHEGDFEGECYLIGKHARIALPSDVDPSTVVLQGDQVVARSVGGTASALATLADLQAQVAYLRKQFDSITGHTHAGPGSPPTESAVPPAGTSSVPTPAGTTVLQGE